MGTDISQFTRKYRERNEGDFTQTMGIELLKGWDLKYGENPAQKAAIYKVQSINEDPVDELSFATDVHYARTDDQGKGGLSLTNTMDITRAMDVLKYFEELPAVAIMKHNIVAGFAKQTTQEQTMAELFRLARDADIRSNFGGTLVITRPMDMETAQAMYELKGINPFFVDVLAAPGFEDGVIEYVQAQSKNIRIGQFRDLSALPRFQGDGTYGLLSFKDMPCGMMGVQEMYLTSIKSAADFIVDPMVVDKNGEKHEILKMPSKRELDDLLTAWYLNVAGARSNGVVFVKDGVSVAMGSGQVERVGAIEQAIVKGMQKAMDREGREYDALMGMAGYEKLSRNPFEGACCSSDAFFPNPDSIDRLARVGVTAVVQPYGSIMDAKVIDAANRYGIAMPATLERCFGHF